MSLREKYHNKIAESLGCSLDSIFTYWKGRVALYAAVKAIGVAKGDEIVLQAFTCVVVTNAVIYANATPVYVDVDKKTCNMTLEGLKPKISAKTKVVIIQNTFGLSSEVQEIVVYCSSMNIVCIEDCTHGFGGSYNGHSNGSIADFAFYSTQWNKPFSTGVGGILRVNNKDYLSKIKEVNTSAVNPTFKEEFILSSLIKARTLLLNDATYWVLIKLYRKLTALNLVVGSSSPVEIESPILPKDFLKLGSPVQFKAGIKALNKLPKVLQTRAENAELIARFLSDNGKYFVNEELVGNHSFLIYPILVKDRALFMDSAEKKGLPFGDWFISPLHPVESQFELWQLDVKDYPFAQQLSEHILNVPLSSSNINRYLKFLEEQVQELM